MANLNGFNANHVEPTKEFDPLPAGKYLAAISDSEMKSTKKGDGSFLELEFTILEGEFKGRKVWDRLCLNHQKDKVQKIARGNLSAICRAVGVLQPRDSVELHNLPLVIAVKCKRRDDTGEFTNVVKGFLEKSAKGEVKSAAAGQPQQAPANDTTPPWKR